MTRAEQAILAESKLSLRARAVLLILYDMQGTKSCCWPSVRTLSARTAMSRATVKRAIAELRDAQEIHITWRREKRSSSTYTVRRRTGLNLSPPSAQSEPSAGSICAEGWAQSEPAEPSQREPDHEPDHRTTRARARVGEWAWKDLAKHLSQGQLEAEARLCSPNGTHVDLSRARRPVSYLIGVIARYEESMGRAARSEVPKILAKYRPKAPREPNPPRRSAPDPTDNVVRLPAPDVPDDPDVASLLEALTCTA